MRTKPVFIALAMLVLWPLAAFADDSDEFTIKVDPFHFGLGCLATWERDAGKPGQKDDSQQFGLYLQKNTATANFAAAGVRNMLRTPIPATSLQTLAFVISGFPGEPLRRWHWRSAAPLSPWRFGWRFGSLPLRFPTSSF